jgi:hypothetical protein
MKLTGYEPWPTAMYVLFANVGLPTVLNEPGRIVLMRGSYVPIVLAVGLPWPITTTGVAEKVGANTTYLGVPTLMYPD